MRIILYTGKGGVGKKIIPVDDGYLLELILPFAQKGAVALSQKGDELTIKIGDYKRNIILPRKLFGRQAMGAKLEDHVLKIKFEDNLTRRD